MNFIVDFLMLPLSPPRPAGHKTKLAMPAGNLPIVPAHQRLSEEGHGNGRIGHQILAAAFESEAQQVEVDFNQYPGGDASGFRWLKFGRRGLYFQLVFIGISL